MPDYAHLMTSRASRKEYEEAVLHLLEFPEDMEVLWRYFTTGKTQERTRSAWVLQQLSDANHAIFVPWQKRFIIYSPQAKTDAEKRFISRLFSKHGLPKQEELQGKLLDQTFTWLLDLGESIADQLPNSTAAFKSRATHILKDLIRL